LIITVVIPAAGLLLAEEDGGGEDDERATFSSSSLSASTEERLDILLLASLSLGYLVVNEEEGVRFKNRGTRAAHDPDQPAPADGG
jgi:hypothetical protein